MCVCVSLCLDNNLITGRIFVTCVKRLLFHCHILSTDGRTSVSVRPVLRFDSPKAAGQSELRIIMSSRVELDDSGMLQREDEGH